jgi:FHS family Na+ dependent glucose MFS transporter 1
MDQAAPSYSEHTGKFIKTVIYYTGFISLGLASASLGPTLPDLAQGLQAKIREISILFTARSAGYLTSSILIGRIYDKKPGHPIMASVLVVMGIMLLLAPIAPALWILTAAMFVLGMGEGSLDVGTNTLLVWVHRKNVGPYMNGLHFFFGLGAFLAPVVVAQVMLGTGSLRWTYGMLAACMLPAAIGLTVTRSPSRPDETKSTARANYRNLLSIVAALLLALYVGAEVGYGGWIFTYSRSLNLTNETSAAYLTSAFWGALTAGRLLAVPISTRVSPGRLLAGSLACCLVSLAVILTFSGSIIAIWCGSICLGLSMAAIFPSTITFVEQRTPISGKTTSIFFIGASLGGMLIPWTIGQFFDAVGPGSTMYIILVVLSLAVFVYAILNNLGARKPLSLKEWIAR